MTACTAGGSSSVPAFRSVSARSHFGTTASPIQHIVLVIQENRSFNNFFATFPGATGATTGLEKVGKGTKYRSKRVTLKEVPLIDRNDPNHSYTAFLTAYNSGKMNGFNLIQFYAQKRDEGMVPYEYVNPSYITPYWTMASQYGLANAMFQTQGSESYTAHQDLIRGGTEIDQTASLIDDPANANSIWGCDSDSKTVTSLITTNLQLEKNAGPFPCTSHFPYSGTQYLTLSNLLDAKSVSWKYYTPQLHTGGDIWNAFDTIASVRYSSEWGTNVNWPPTNVFTDISGGTLPAVSWVIPDGADSDHPANKSDTGPSWVASIVNAVGASQYWNTCAIVVVWDDWGGFYDPVAPPTPRDMQGGPGFRVPMIVISPYARETSASHPGYISNTVYGFGSIIQFVEDTFDLGSLGTTDATSNSMLDMFNFKQSPRQFQTISSKYSKGYFLRRGPTQIPVDTH
jgi:phospholipase C